MACDSQVADETQRNGLHLQQRGPKTSHGNHGDMENHSASAKANPTPRVKFLIPFISIPIHSLLTSDNFGAHFAPRRLLQEYQVGCCLVQFLNNEVAPASPVLTGRCGEKRHFWPQKLPFQ